jgi:hypothetical protein
MKWVLPVFALFFLVYSAAAQPSADMFYITRNYTAVRECPSLRCKVLYRLEKETPFLAVGTETGEALNNQDTWLIVADPVTGQRGYLHRLQADDVPYDDWRLLPVVPPITEAMRAVYQRGLELGNNPRAFSKVGDCQNVASFFLHVYDTPDEFRLGPFESLRPTIDHFAGSWGRHSAAVDNGYNVASVLSPLWANPKLCEAGETPLACEYRLHQPSIAIISMETWWAQRPVEIYEDYLGQIVAFWIERGVVPVVATKADNLEGSHQINAAVARVAARYEVPLWNFWLAVQPLPNHGLTEDGFHLTFARSFFDDPARLRSGWPIRNLTALQVIDAVWRGVNEEN